MKITETVHRPLNHGKITLPIVEDPAIAAGKGKDRVDFVVGGFRSEAVLAMQEVAEFIPRISLQDVYHAIHPGWYMLCLLFPC